MPEKRPLPSIEVWGHRGARAVLPENTLAGFEYAIAQGVDGIELDLAVTRDDVVVVSHDPVLHRPKCSGPRGERAIHKLSFGEIREWDCGKRRNRRFPRQRTVPGARMPSLAEVLALAREGSFRFALEIKSDPRHPGAAPPPERFARLVLDQIREHGLEARVLVLSFDFRVLHAMHRLAAEIELVALYKGLPRNFATIARRAGAGIVAPWFRLITQRRVRDAHAAGLRVMAWTPNRPHDWDRLRKAEADAIITDDPAALLARLGRRAD